MFRTLKAASNLHCRFEAIAGHAFVIVTIKEGEEYLLDPTVGQLCERRKEHEEELILEGEDQAWPVLWLPISQKVREDEFYFPTGSRAVFCCWTDNKDQEPLLSIHEAFCNGRWNGGWTMAPLVATNQLQSPRKGRNKIQDLVDDEILIPKLKINDTPYLVSYFFHRSSLRRS